MSATRLVTFDTVCKQVTSEGLIQSSNSNSNGEDVGYPYRDVVKQANGSPFTYVSSSPETEFYAAAE